MRDQLIFLSANSTMSLQGQLREKLVAAILDGQIPPGSPLPSGRKLAKQLGVARNTVVLAYEQLVDAGFLVARERSGYYVNDDILSGKVSPAPRQPRPDVETPDWRRRIVVKPSAQRNIVKPRDWREYRYPFITGQFDQALFPVADWRDCVRQTLTVQAIHEWVEDSVDQDDPLLIEQIRTRVLPRRGVMAQADEILVTVGAQQALYLLARLLITPEQTVGMEDPGYADARNTFSLKTPKLVRLAVDEAGLALGKRVRQCDYVYVTPSHQYPTTVTMPLNRRQALLELATEADFVVIEDDYESETNYVGEPTPALKSLDEGDRVIYVGSLSKSLAPGLRLGYLVGPSDLITEARALRRLMLRHPPNNNQRTVALFLAAGHHDSLIRRLSHHYKYRWQTLGDALARYLPESSRIPTFGGTSFWVEGPPDLDARKLMGRAAQSSILIEPGDVDFMSERPPRHYFRLGFSSIPADRIETGIRLLADLI
ncbi:MAG: PLP-dependent aminotransferase family protein [Gammaproteobacteria bacterium]